MLGNALERERDGHRSAHWLDLPTTPTILEPCLGTLGLGSVPGTPWSVLESGQAYAWPCCIAEQHRANGSHLLGSEGNKVPSGAVGYSKRREKPAGSFQPHRKRSTKEKWETKVPSPCHCHEITDELYASHRPLFNFGNPDFCFYFLALIWGPAQW